LEDELWIWRPILAGKCTLEGVLSGLVGVDELLKLNALLDMSTAYENYAHYKQEKSRK
jgi:hypothetical protein